MARLADRHHSKTGQVVGFPGSNRQPMTFHASYAASRISSNLKDSTKQFGWLQAPRNQNFFPFSNFCEACNHPNLYAVAEIRESCV